MVGNPLDYLREREEVTGETLEASLSVDEVLRRNLEQYQDPDEDWSYGVLQEPDIKGIVPEKSGTAFIYENGRKILEQEYGNAVMYLDENMDLESIDQIGVIDPFETDSAPTSILMIQELDETQVIEDDYGNPVELGVILDTQVYFGERVEGTQIFSRYKEPGEGFDFNVENI